MADSVARDERLALCTLFDVVGPLAPTLCEGWTTSDLVAHLYVRERRPLEAAGILIAPLAPLTERAMEAAKAKLGYKALVEAVRNGPPFPTSLVDAGVNTVEYFVHHEDVRRAEEGWEPRQDSRLDQALWSLLKRSAWLLARRVKGVGLELEADGFGTAAVKAGSSSVVMKGGPQELVLFLFGRRDVARVELEGPQSAVETLRGARLGL
jgi:uncharacterized protein (TIGR03085 family)